MQTVLAGLAVFFCVGEHNKTIALRDSENLSAEAWALPADAPETRGDS